MNHFGLNYMKTGTVLPTPDIKERAEAAAEHLKRSVEWKGERVGIMEMRRHYSNYFKGISHFKETRMKLVTEDDYTALMQVLSEIGTLHEEITL